MSATRPFPADVLDHFRADISKDEHFRGRDRRSVSAFLKQARDAESARREFETLRLLADARGENLVPRPLEQRGCELHLELVEGIRLYDLLRLLRRMGSVDVALQAGAERAALVLLERCRARVERMQALLAEAAGRLSVGPYPCDIKVAGMFALLSQLLGLPPLSATERTELDAFKVRWDEQVSVPFRDATPKNVIVAAESLAIGRHVSEAARRTALARLLAEAGDDFWRTVPLFDIDFSAVEHLTTPEDDLVSLLAHEVTFELGARAGEGLAFAQTLKLNPQRAAYSIFVRYLRFGGRKVAYQVVNPQGGATRFRHDRFGFYFDRMPRLVAGLYPQMMEQMPAIMARWSAIADAAEPFEGGGRQGPDLYLETVGRPVQYWQESPLELAGTPAFADLP